jgi:hypothetical protein
VKFGIDFTVLVERDRDVEVLVGGRLYRVYVLSVCALSVSCGTASLGLV